MPSNDDVGRSLAAQATTIAHATAPTHPRPQLQREWRSLDGTWDFALDPDARWRAPGEVSFDRKILVPFAPETEKSGIGDTGLFRACWYRRRVEVPDLATGERWALHFGAVDYVATVWIDGAFAAEHEGGYTPFHIDLTPFTRDRNGFEIVVRADDDPFDLAKPRGKQDWNLEPHSIWYPRTSGIWQTVWLERVPDSYIARLRWTPNLTRWELDLDAEIGGGRDDLRLGARLHVGDHVLADDNYLVVNHEVHRRIALSDPGIDDSRNGLLWRPSSPTLIDVELELRDGSGAVLDRVTSYTALREIGIQGDRVVLNGRPFPLRMVLDQGYWRESGLTAPNEAALRRDVELARAMGFNGVRKHQKIEDPRYLYWADRLGLLVWAEMPSAYRFTRRSIERMTRQWIDVIERDYSHPCVMAWVPMNESWGVPNLPDSAPERHYVEALYHLTHTLDSTRPVIGNDGWESVATDIIGIHDYDHLPERIRRRYQVGDQRPRLFSRERPGGRVLVLGGEAHNHNPVVLSEFGGIALALSSAESSWGYSRAPTEEELAQRYEELIGVVRSLELVCGFCYTQFTDTYQEANGLLYADRTPKFPIERMRLANRGRISDPAAAMVDEELPGQVSALDEDGDAPA